MPIKDPEQRRVYEHKRNQTPARKAAKRGRYEANKEARTAAQRPKNRARRAEYATRIDNLKRDSGCVDCETKEGRLDFDHVDPTTKLFGLSYGHLHSRQAVEEEIAKCVVRCVHCHLQRHSEDGTFHEAGK
jgi:hypothetical protein